MKVFIRNISIMHFFAWRLFMGVSSIGKNTLKRIKKKNRHSKVENLRTMDSQI